MQRPRAVEEDTKPLSVDLDLPFAEVDDEWEAATRDVRPLADRDEPPAARGDDVPEIGLADRLRVRQEQAAASAETPLFTLDRRTAERLRRGQIPIEEQLDLHGLTQEEALSALEAFLLRAWTEGRRCVLVITGKGTAREGGGVLRSMIPAWLAEPEHHEHVLAVEAAQPHHGGDGALYVLLRRQRERE